MLGPLDDGSGLCLGGIDLDSYYDRETGDMTPDAREVIRRFHSYTEVSPSGAGVKVFFLYLEGKRPGRTAGIGAQPA